MTNTEFQIPETNENFEALLNEQFGDNGITGSVVKGTIVRVTPDFAIVDVGLKSEGRIPLREFGQNAELKAGDKVEVYVDRYEDKDGQIVLSREKARREEVWQDLEKSLNAGERVNGVIFGRVKGGFTVDLNGAIAFLPGSQIDIRPIRDITPLMGISQPFQILKMDKVRGNIVVSRRVVLEETRAEARAELIDTLKEGSILEGVVKNITDYGAFVELEDGIEGLVHVSEMSWTRKNVHPGKIVSTSQEVEVKVLEVDPEKRRISLGIKQCMPNPWAAYVEEHPVGSVIEGKIKNITEFGLFVGLSDEIDGMIHLSDISWDKSGEEAVKDYVKGQDIQAKIIDVDVEKERISLGIKQLSENTLATALDGIKKGDVVKATVVSTEDKGVNVEVNGVASMIKKADLSKEKANQNPDNFKEGDVLEAKVTSVDKKNNKLGLSVKALEIEEEKKALEEYSNTSTGSTLGDALGEALKKNA